MESVSQSSELDFVEEDIDACTIFPEVSGFQIRTFRQQKNMTQVQFAKAYDIPLSTLKRWESEKNVPRISQGFKVAFTEWAQSFSRSRQHI